MLTATLLPGTVSAKVLLLTQSGIGAYETVATAIKGKLTDVETRQLDDFASPEALAAAVTATSPSAVVVVGVQAAQLASQAKLTAPSIFCMVPERERSRLAAANVTGISLDVPLAAQLEALRRILPSVKRVGVIYDPKYSAAVLSEARSAASGLGVQLVERPVSGPGEIKDAFAEIGGKIDVLWMVQDKTVGTGLGFKVLLVESLERKLPLVAYSGSFVENGALLSLSPDFDRTAGNTVAMVQQVLAGKAPSAIPWMEGPGQLVINTKVAGRLGIALPPALTAGARLVQ